ncbi:conserved hypothetical protein [Hyella patelloides LEGE 07179]|uniref:PhoD-like phosphatase n=1 Tax=Hyella patelloides LEGE 07179 TaxID=945734 RepID=A0A563VLQ3_9CYAN|nr:PhoD-like phosphatase [Hyella patelloides]VEP12287.1 conserved hypothetical protein [Hyella patelloides LEGE 07179]
MHLLQSITEYLPKVENLPLILAGPILRHTEPNSVTVWLALKESESLCLEIYETKNKGAIIGKLLLKGQRDTIQLGKHLHIVAITAKASDGILLQPENIYAYNVYCSSDRYSLIDDTSDNNYSLSYFSHQLPTFALPPEDINDLNIIHGSCRKPHGGGKDTLSSLDHLLKDTVHSANNRPHQLFLTGDQIYGDDVADPILWLTQGVNNLLFGWSEELPLQEGTILADELPPGKRSEIARIEGGLTAMLQGKSEKAKSHLFSFGEYAAAYLFAWSPILMPDRFPDSKTLFDNRQQRKQWEQELDDIHSFISDLSKVRRAFANIPVYTICDDHDVSDDWYLNREWCDRVLGKPLGKRVVQNGLLAYALFQAWGNTPQYFEAETTGAKLLQLASEWLVSGGKNLSAKEKCDRYLGIPVTNLTTGLPQLELDEDVLILARDSQAIPWHYHLSNSKHEVIVFDTRTWRGYTQGAGNKLEPPMLLCPKAFQQQLEIPLQKSNPETEVTLVVLPTNLVALGIIDRIQQFELNRNRVFSSDVGDAWNFHTSAFVQLLLSFCQQRKRVVILSGDIHYSCAVRLTHWFHESLETTVLAQLTSSAIKNSELSTRLVHTKIKSLLPEKTERWLGWEQPLKLKRIKQPWWWRNQNNLEPKDRVPDWQYRIEWCPRQPAKSLSWQQSPSKSDRRNNFWQKLINGFFSLLWRNRWLQEGTEVIGRNNFSLVKFRWSTTKTVIQETYWHPPWTDTGMVKSGYEVSLEPEPLPPLPKNS